MSSAETEKTSAEKRESYGNGRSTRFGYRLEWRLTTAAVEANKALGFDMSWAPLGKVGKDWERSPYDIKALPVGPVGEGMRKVIQPTIGQFDDHLVRHGLVTRRVAEAVFACLRTVIPKQDLGNIEWRIVEIELKETHSMEMVCAHPCEVVSTTEPAED